MTDAKKTNAGLEKQYFEEANQWDHSINESRAKSEKRAWRVGMVASAIAALEALAIVTMLPLKTVEPFVIRVDNNTGMVDVISTLAESDGVVKQDAQEVIDKYWLGQYIRHRERYLFNARDYDRKVVGLLSSTAVQQEYAAYTDPQMNPHAPVTMYSEGTEVEVAVKSITFINQGEVFNGEKRVTALVRYTKQVQKSGTRTLTTHWAATITFVYRSASMSIEDRLINPLGFQVIDYRNDPESVGG